MSPVRLLNFGIYGTKVFGLAMNLVNKGNSMLVRSLTG